MVVKIFKDSLFFFAQRFLPTLSFLQLVSFNKFSAIHGSPFTVLVRIPKLIPPVWLLSLTVPERPALVVLAFSWHICSFQLWQEHDIANYYSIGQDEFQYNDTSNFVASINVLLEFPTFYLSSVPIP